MKKIIIPVLCVFVFGESLISCQDNDNNLRHTGGEPSSYSYYAWINESGHEITLSLSGARFDDSDRPGYKKEGFENKVLAPGARFEEKLKEMRAPMPPTPSWTMTVRFDGQPEIIFRSEYDGEKYIDFPEGYDHDFNPVIEWNYTREHVENPEGNANWEATRWTYTFTDEDYNAAVEYAETIPEE